MIKLSGPLLARYDSNSKFAKKFNSVTKRIAEKDPTIWGAQAEQEAAIRLNWVDLPKTSKALLPRLEEICKWAEIKNYKTLVLCGMGGSSLAPEVFGKTFKKNIVVLDSTNPEQIADALNNDLKSMLVIVGSKSGSTIETSSQISFFKKEFERNEIDARDHFVVITDPDSPLDISSRENGYQVINADPKVGGRFSALTAFGLVPAALMGIDVKNLLSQANETSSHFIEADSQVVKVATLLMEQSDQFIAFSDKGSDLPGISDWIEQLIAESTGKDGVGRLPVVLESVGSEISGTAPLITFLENTGDLSVAGDLASQFIFWEWVTALLGYGLGVDPFNQPNVTEAKERTSSLLSTWKGAYKAPKSDFEDEEISIFCGEKVSSLDEALAKFFAPKHGYIAITAYLNREKDCEVTKLRELIADKQRCPTTFGWGPRFLHSTGQFHKGGQPNGAFLQISGESSIDFQIPNRDFTFQTLLMAQALGDGEALSSRQFPVLRIHLKDRDNGIAKIINAVKRL